MLTANDQTATLTVATTAERSAAYFCPGCQAPVILKRGLKVIAHFAHRAKTNCQLFAEGETDAHLTGKWQLAAYCEPTQVELEPYLPTIEQRPDLLLTTSTRRIAIEYQCSPITIAQLDARNRGYRQLAIEPCWILGDTYRLKLTKLGQMDKFLRYSDKYGWHLLFWCTTTGELEIWAEIRVDFWGQLSYTRLRHHRVIEKVRPIKRRTSQNFRQRLSGQLLYKHARTLKWQEYCYQHHGLLQAMPEICFSAPNSVPVWLDASCLWRYFVILRLQEKALLTVVTLAQWQEWADQAATLMRPACLIQCSDETIQRGQWQQLDTLLTLLEENGCLKRLSDQRWQFVATPS